MEIGIGLPFFEEKLHLPAEFVPKTYHTEGIAAVRKIRYKGVKRLRLRIPAHDQSQTKRLMIDEPFDLKLGVLAFGKLANNGFQSAILARLEARAVFTKGNC